MTSATCACGCGEPLPDGNRSGFLRRCGNRLRMRSSEDYSALIPVSEIRSLSRADGGGYRMVALLACGHTVERAVANRLAVPGRSKCAECGRDHRIRIELSRVPVDDAEHLWTRVSPEPNTGCWLWVGNYDKNGYGLYGCGRPEPRRFAHRFVWELLRGPIPKGLCVCHHCDNPPCVNPAHLFLGTHADNMADMWRKGRGFSPFQPKARTA